MKTNTVNRTSTGQALESVMMETLQTFFQLRALGIRLGAVSPWGGGYWGLLRILKIEGPRTVPQLARARSVSRQRMQKLADEMVKDGVVKLVDNPAHRRSKFLQLTPEGEQMLQELTARVAREAEQLAQDMDEQELRITVNILKELRYKLEKHLMTQFPRYED